MTLRRIGRSDLEVPPLCLGGNVFGWTADEATSFAVLDAALDAGLTFIDTADSYSRWVPGNQGGESEAIIGRWMKARGTRNRVVIATKVGSDMGQGHKDLSKAWILKEVEDSLRRLQVDTIDLYQSHWDDPQTPIEETLEAYDALVKAGKVRVIGASNFSPERLQSSLEISARKGLPRYECLQPEYNLYARSSFEGPLQRLCLENEIGVITYFSLASGFLSGKYRSADDFAQSARGQGMAKYLNDRGFAILAALDAVAARHGTRPAQVALAWIMAQPGVTAPIASATSPMQVSDLAAATRLVLSAEDLAQLDRGSAWS
jgi:aryl-alcohol dehydrogenase-like predicted oxidoreductase